MLGKLKTDTEIWNLFTRKEEYGLVSTDQFDRFSSRISANKSIGTPLSSDFLLKTGWRPEYPGGYDFCICMTHDIDLLNFRTWKIPSERIYSINSIRKISTYICKRFGQFWNFDEIIEMEEKRRAKSTFFFLALAQGDLDLNYMVDEIKDGFRLLRNKEREISLHGGNEAYKDRSVLTMEKERLEKAAGTSVVGCRNHYIRFRIPVTWKIQSEVGFQYDATFGYPEIAGFRNGMCHPYRPFDLETGKTIDLVEIPLAAMDATLFHYMNLDIEGAWKATKRIIDDVKERKGAVSIIWHNNYLLGEKGRLYERILDYCKELNCWMPTCRELVKWYTDNGFFEESLLRK